MGSDISRSTFDPNKHYSGVRQQQGRVNLDADWNEQVDIAAHRVQKETFDVIGPSGAPRDNAGFQIQGPGLWTPNTNFALGAQIIDSNGKIEIAIVAGTSGASEPANWPATAGNTMTETGSTLTWQLVNGADLIISPGRMYVDGLLCELSPIVLPIENFKGDGTGAAGTQVQVSSALLDDLRLQPSQWMQISAQGSQAPQLVQITAVNAATGSLTFANSVSVFGSPNTNPQLQPITTYLTQPDYPSSTPRSLPNSGTSIVYLNVWERTVSALQDPHIQEIALGGPDTTTRTQTIWQVKLVDVSSVSGVNCSTPTSGIPGWQQIVQPSAAQLTTGVAQSGSSGPCCLASNTGYTGMENQLYRVDIHQAGTPMPNGTNPLKSLPAGTATFKWSRDNASVTTAVTGIAPVTNSAGKSASQLTVESLGRYQVLGLTSGNWVEITDDWQELNGQSGELHKIDTIDPVAKTVTLDATVSSTNFPVTSGETDPGRHTRLTRWDQHGQVNQIDSSNNTQLWIDLDSPGSTGDIPVPPQGTTLLLENGITVTFDSNPVNGLFYAGDFWNFAARSADGSVEALLQAYPRGIQHHYCRLGVIDFDAKPWTVQDCRRVFPPMADPGIHVTGVTLAGSGAALLNDSTIVVESDLVKGIEVEFDAPVDPTTIIVAQRQPTFAVTVDLPAMQGGKTIGFTPLIIPASTTGTAPKTGFDNTNTAFTWLPSADASAALAAAVSGAGVPVLAHLTLKGNFIWALGQPDSYLEGDVFGIPYVDASNILHTGLLFPTGTGRRGGDFDMWFWLTSAAPLTASPTTLNFGNQLVGAPSASQNVTVTNNTATPITVTISPAGDFSQTNTCGSSVVSGGTCTITLTFIPQQAGARTATLSVSAGAAIVQIALIGTGTQANLTPSPLSLNFPSEIVGTTSAPLNVTLTNNGGAAASISSITTTGDFSQTNTCGTSPLAPQAACTISVRFSPTAPGRRIGTLTITSASGQSVSVNLSGTGRIAKDPLKDASDGKPARDKVISDGKGSLAEKVPDAPPGSLTRNALPAAGNQAVRADNAEQSDQARRAFIRPEERPPIGKQALGKADEGQGE